MSFVFGDNAWQDFPPSGFKPRSSLWHNQIQESPEEKKKSVEFREAVSSECFYRLAFIMQAWEFLKETRVCYTTQQPDICPKRTSRGLDKCCIGPPFSFPPAFLFSTWLEGVQGDSFFLHFSIVLISFTFCSFSWPLSRSVDLLNPSQRVNALPPPTPYTVSAVLRQQSQ